MRLCSEMPTSITSSTGWGRSELVTTNQGYHRGHALNDRRAATSQTTAAVRWTADKMHHLAGRDGCLHHRWGQLLRPANDTTRLSAAFNCVDHDILLSTLNITYDIGYTVHSWMLSYLSGRTQSLRVNGASSSTEKLQYGVPQGSVLGPLLFMLYTTDLDVIVTNHGFMSPFYADDSQLHLYCRLDQTEQLRIIMIA